MRDAADGYRSLLSPGFVDTQNDTDRVIQLVTWDFDITHPGLPGAEDARLNFNQAGDLTNLFAPTFSVSSPDIRGCATDVRSGLIDSWNPRLSPYMREYSTLYTHYEIVGAGSILVRKVLYLGALYAGGAGTTGITAPGNQPTYPALYLENWTPFNFPVFNAMALSVDGSGRPNWWYNRDNFPAYPNLQTTSTYGYSILFDESRPAASNMVGLAFGSKPAECVGGPCSIQAVFNSMSWNDGMGCSPRSICETSR